MFSQNAYILEIKIRKKNLCSQEHTKKSQDQGSEWFVGIYKKHFTLHKKQRCFWSDNRTVFNKLLSVCTKWQSSRILDKFRC